MLTNSIEYGTIRYNQEREKIMTMPLRVKDRKTTEKLSPAMLRYLRAVIDTPIEGRGLDSEVARSLNRTRSWAYTMKKKVEERLTREELLEVCSMIMNEVE